MVNAAVASCRAKNDMFYLDGVVDGLSTLHLNLLRLENSMPR